MKACKLIQLQKSSIFVYLRIFPPNPPLSFDAAHTK